MRYPGVNILLIGAVCGLGLAAGQTKGDAAAGKALYEKTCKPCHGPTGAGNPAIAKSLGVTLKPLGSKEVQAKSDDELKKSMLGGYGKKKPIKTLDDAKIKDISAYVRTLGK